MDKLRLFWKRTPAVIRRPLVFMIGLAVILAGIAMLVLPGPGWAAIFLGFAILATEFAFAERVRDWLIMQVKRAISYVKEHWRRPPQRPKN